VKSLVSVVIPTYNRARELERALKSVLAQTYPNWEALVVDNHSSDNTDDVVAGFGDSRIKLFKIQNNGVIAASRNLGLKHARGEYVAFLDSDDWWSPRKLEKSINYLDEGADVVYHDLFVASKPGQTIFWRKGRTRVLRTPAFEDLLVNGNGLQTSSVVARKSILQEIAGMSEDASLIGCEDYDAWLRAARITERFKRVPRALGYYWRGSGNTSSLERSIRIYDHIKVRHAKALAELPVRYKSWWIEYSKGRAYYRIGANAMAESNLQQLHWRQIPYVIAIKSLWMLAMIKFVYRMPK
jgi:glycosyltransferase involved in cell wall biosynthesis